MTERTAYRSIKGWMIIRRGRPVIYRENHLRPMLMFATKRRAQEAIWRDGEKVIPVVISIRNEQPVRPWTERAAYRVPEV